MSCIPFILQRAHSIDGKSCWLFLSNTCLNRYKYKYKIDINTQHVRYRITSSYLLFFQVPIFITFGLIPFFFLSFFLWSFVYRQVRVGYWVCVCVCECKISIHQSYRKPKPKTLRWKKYSLGASRVRVCMCVNEWHNNKLTIPNRQTLCRHCKWLMYFVSFLSHYHHLSISVLRIFVFSTDMTATKINDKRVRINAKEIFIPFSIIIIVVFRFCYKNSRNQWKKRKVHTAHTISYRKLAQLGIWTMCSSCLGFCTLSLSLAHSFIRAFATTSFEDVKLSKSQLDTRGLKY